MVDDGSCQSEKQMHSFSSSKGLCAFENLKKDQSGRSFCLGFIRDVLSNQYSTGLISIGCQLTSNISKRKVRSFLHFESKINNIMLIKLLNQRLSPLIVFLKRSVIVRSNFNLANEMKLLNDKKQFNKTLQLFDNYKKANTQTISSFIIIQALKACAHLRDIQYGSAIHHLISSRIKDDRYISASLIHMYSKI